MIITSGTWTPTLQDVSASDAEGQTYSSQLGRYTRINNTIFFRGYLQLTSFGTLTGDMLIGGLPYLSSSSANGGTLIVNRSINLNILAGSNIAGLIPGGTNVARLHIWDTTTGSQPLDISKITNSSYFSFEGQYNID